MDLRAIFRRRRKIVIATLLGCIVLGALYCAFSTRRFEAKGTIQVQKESADGMGLDSLMSGAEGASDALGANINLQTQANILQSETLALRTIEDLHMEGTQDFKTRWNPVSAVLGLILPSGLADAPGATLENAPERRRRALKVFSKNLKVKPVGGTRIIEIAYSNPDPKLAAAVVNKLTQSLIDYTFQTRFDATNQAAAWLSGQLNELRQESENLQAKVVDLQKQVGVYSLGTTDAQGREQAYSEVLERLQQATTATTAAEQNRILKGAVARAAETGNAEMLSGLAGNAMTGQSQSVANSLGLLQNLRQQEATQTSNLAEMEAKYGVDYPRVAELKNSIANTNRAIRDEVNRIKGRAQSDYQVAQQAEIGTRGEYEAAKKQASLLNDKAVEYAIVRQEAEQSRLLYEDLLKRLKEAGVLQGLKPSNITIIDSGRAPARPTKPNVPLYMLIAMGGGLFFGCCGALVADAVDDKVNGIGDLEQLTGQTLLGTLPQVRDIAGEDYVVSREAPHSIYTEAMRAIRTSLLLWQGGQPPKVLLVTSSIAGEGKSGVSVNLAHVLAQHGRKVLLVDTDLRRGTLATRLGQLHGFGLSTMLAGQWGDKSIPEVEGVPGLFALQAGLMPPNPSEMIDSDEMRGCLAQWRTQYDFIVLDGAPVLPVTDSVVLSALADVTLLVVRNGVVGKPQVKHSYQTIAKKGKASVGLILNGLKMHDDDYAYYGSKSHKEDAHA